MKALNGRFQQPYPFRDHHLFELLKSYSEGTQPLDVAIYHYFKQHKALGSKDRAEISEMAYGVIRWLGILEALLPGSGWPAKVRLYRNGEWRQRSDLPEHIAVSFPEVLFEALCSNYGRDKAKELCLVCNEPAPTCVRVNTLKCSRDDLLKRWEGQHNVIPTEQSPDGIIFREKIHFYSQPEFQEGLFELQDEGSQLVAQLVEAKPKDLVMDYCAGAGGKALALATRMGGKGQLFLHDIRQHTLLEAKKRLKRAGIQNAQLMMNNSPSWSKCKGKMDWVLVDVPCSGTGTLRRNPDMKWRFSEEMVKRLQEQQRVIFEEALNFLKPGGKIVYATCSVLSAENEEQIAHFCTTHGLEISGAPFKSLPSQGKMDGFFAATMQKQL